MTGVETKLDTLVNGMETWQQVGDDIDSLYDAVDINSNGTVVLGCDYNEMGSFVFLI